MVLPVLNYEDTLVNTKHHVIMIELIIISIERNKRFSITKEPTFKRNVEIISQSRMTESL